MKSAWIPVMPSVGDAAGEKEKTGTLGPCAVFTMSVATSVLFPQVAFGQPAVENDGGGSWTSHVCCCLIRDALPFVTGPTQYRTRLMFLAFAEPTGLTAST